MKGEALSADTELHEHQKIQGSSVIKTNSLTTLEEHVHRMQILSITKHFL